MSDQKYRIVKWRETFETADSKRYKNLNWVSWPIAPESSGFLAMLEEFEDEAPTIYGAWCALVLVAARAPTRGELVDTRQKPYTVSRIARQVGFPVEPFKKLIEWALREDVMWLEVIDTNDSHPGDTQATNDSHPGDKRQQLSGTPATQPDQTRPDITQPPTSNPNSAATEGNANAGKLVGWGEVEDSLLTRGVGQAATALATAKEHGCDPELVSGVIQHYDGCWPNWEPGGLYRRIELLRPGQEVDQLWPQPSLAGRQQQEQKAQHQRQQGLEEQRQRIEAERVQAELRYAELEARHGDELESLDRAGVIALIGEASPENPEFLITIYNRKGLTGAVRSQLIEHLGKRREPIVEQTTPEAQGAASHGS